MNLLTSLMRFFHWLNSPVTWTSFPPPAQVNMTGTPAHISPQMNLFFLYLLLGGSVRSGCNPSFKCTIRLLFLNCPPHDCDGIIFPGIFVLAIFIGDVRVNEDVDFSFSKEFNFFVLSTRSFISVTTGLIVEFAIPM